jgi:hypothetical protein
MSADFSRIEARKRQMRKRLAALPFAEKLRIVEELHERTLAIRATSLGKRKQATPAPSAANAPL